MALKFFVAQIESVTFPGNEHNIKTSPIVFVPELFVHFINRPLPPQKKRILLCFNSYLSFSIPGVNINDPDTDPS